MIDFKLNNPTGTEYEIKSTPIWFGQVVRKYQLPKALVNRLNEEIDGRKDHSKWNDYLAGNLETQNMLYFKDDKGQIKQSVSDSFVDVFKNLGYDYMSLVPHVKSYQADLMTIWYNDQRKTHKTILSRVFC